jgi:hypothetical protein
MKKQFLVFLVIAVLFSTFFIACKRNNGSSSNAAPADIMLINAYPGDTAALDFILMAPN